MNRAERFSYRDRRVRKRQFRTLWIQRIGAAARNAGMSYSQLMHGLKAAGVEIDRKMLADIAVKDAAGFTQLAEQAKASLGAQSQGVTARATVQICHGERPSSAQTSRRIFAR